MQHSTTVALASGILLCVASMSLNAAAPQEDDRQDAVIQRQYQELVRPFLKSYCLGCHGEEVQEAKLDLSGYETIDSVRRDVGHWEIILERLEAGEMPPEDADVRPTKGRRTQIVQWIQWMRRREADRNAGDPGLVLARRLSNAEYDYTIHDLTGVDIRPTREFPVDPSNEAGFANSGESLSMSAALLGKYLIAARQVADHMVLTPTGIDFAPHPVVTEPDRDKYCVHRIVAFYNRQPVDYADYFFAAWQYKHQRQSQKPEATLEEVARAAAVSPKYLKTVWQALTDDQHNAGPLAELRRMWSELPADDATQARRQCGAMRAFVIRERQRLIVPVDKSATEQLKKTLQPTILWINRQIAANRRNGRLPRSDSTPETAARIDAIARFCSDFPDAFFVSERGRTFLDPKQRNKGRLLSAGFHLMVGYFRDDQPLYDMVLDEAQQRELDSLWRELDFVTLAPLRQFRDFIYFERAESTRYLTAPEFDFARGEDDDITSPEKMNRVAELFIARAKRDRIRQHGIEVLETYFRELSQHVRRVERDVAAGEPRHLKAVLQFAERAWRRPLTRDDREELGDFYATLRETDGLSHEDALRDVLASILVSPRFSYRIDPPPPGKEARPLSDLALASRLSYFLWSSMPDEELLSHAAAGDLHKREVLIAQTRRMLADPKVRRLAVEFGGNWLDFRQFEHHNGVNRERFTQFSDELQRAMFEEPVRFFVDLVQRDGSVLEFLAANHTFVNPVLARHYGMPAASADPNDWLRVDDAARYGRGGLLPMSVFLTKNSPGLRTSPVKRGFWVVRRVLGEHIPAPPAEVPELPEDEAKLGELSLRQVLSRHRAIESCAGCHRRFDSIGLVFEGYGPIGERREVDLGGRAVDDRAEFPDGSQGSGLEGLRRYLQTKRQDEFVDNMCRKLLAYGLGRSLLLSDQATLERMHTGLAGDEHRFGRMVETIVTSPQFLNRRGRDFDVD